MIGRHSRVYERTVWTNAIKCTYPRVPHSSTRWIFRNISGFALSGPSIVGKLTPLKFQVIGFSGTSNLKDRTRVERTTSDNQVSTPTAQLL